MEFRGYSSRTWSNLLALTAKYSKALPVFEGNMIYSGVISSVVSLHRADKVLQ